MGFIICYIFIPFRVKFLKNIWHTYFSIEILPCKQVFVALHLVFSFIKKLTTYNFNFLFKFPGKKPIYSCQKQAFLSHFDPANPASLIPRDCGIQIKIESRGIPRDWSTVVRFLLGTKMNIANAFIDINRQKESIL